PSFRTDGAEPGETCVGDARKGIGSARQHQVPSPGTERVTRVRDRMIARCAGRREYQAKALETKLARDIRGNQVAGISANELWSELVQRVRGIVIVESLDLARLT